MLPLIPMPPLRRGDEASGPWPACLILALSLLMLLLGGDGAEPWPW